MHYDNLASSLFDAAADVSEGCVLDWKGKMRLHSCREKTHLWIVTNARGIAICGVRLNPHTAQARSAFQLHIKKR